MTAMRTTGPGPLPPRRLPRSARLRAAAGRIIPAALRRFLRETRAAAGIAAALLTVGTVAGAALIVDHVWLYDQRDVLKTAAEAASIAATIDIDRQLANNSGINDDDLEAKLLPVAKRYVLVNLAHLPAKRLAEAKQSLDKDEDGDGNSDGIILDVNRAQRTVKVTVKADLGGTLFSPNLPLVGRYEGPETITVKAGVESESTPIEVVLAIDVSGSMDSTIKTLVWSQTNSRLAVVKRAAKDLVTILDPNGYNRVAVGITPWYAATRLDAQSADEKWANDDDDKSWAVYAGTDSPLPAVKKRCFDGRRFDGRPTDGKIPTVLRDPTALLAPPGEDTPFAQVTCLEHPTRRHLMLSPLMPTLFPLSTDRAAIEDSLDELVTGGGPGTHSSLGVLWAQRMLEPAWKGAWGGTGIHPADRSTPEYADLRKAIVLLTDGEDTNWNGVSRADACAAAKARGTEIFVVAAMHPDHVTGALANELHKCSSEGDDYYPKRTRRPETTYVFLNNATPENLERAFKEIANQLRTLRKVEVS